MNAADMRLDHIADSLVSESEHDYVGVWQLVRRVSKVCDQSSEEAIRGMTLELVRRLLRRGFVAGRLAHEGGFEPWSNQNPDAVLERIDAEWSALGHRPGIDDICWLNLPTSAGCSQATSIR